ncbi:hypothetical protein GIB67_032376 [Kingdonia uniflora]|uniref:Uncharacterized protein n=1 Tax=Kingdonia uniflora TaxID=39325 RepID=A0A7J7MJ08_9MAGN|nr:hypothetical protein GIB67_032376 [Kingdonia uniflora]
MGRGRGFGTELIASKVSRTIAYDDAKRFLFPDVRRNRDYVEGVAGFVCKMGQQSGSPSRKTAGAHPETEGSAQKTGTRDGTVNLVMHEQATDLPNTADQRIFANNRQVHEQHLLQILSGVMQWIDPPDAISNAIECGRTESEMLDGCRTLLSIATLTTPVEFDRLYKLLSPIGTFSLLRALTCEVVKARLASDTDEEKWCWVARDILLDTWTALLEVNS